MSGDLASRQSRGQGRATRYEPSWFLCAIGPEEAHRRSAAHRRAFASEDSMVTVEQAITVTTGDLRCDCRLSRQAAVAGYGEEHGVTLVLHGELYPGSVGNTAERCLRQYLARGATFASSLHGSFAISIVDSRSRRVLFITDPVNSRKLFYGEFEGMTWVSTHHSLPLHPCSGSPDAAGVAHSLVNGVPLNGHTIMDGIEVLSRASVHQVSAAGRTAECYSAFDPEPTEVARDVLSRELQELLIASVRRRLPSQGGVYLSLSGGYDSVSILGAFTRLGVPAGSCFTYRKPGEGRHGDVRVARQMAAVAGYPHEVIEAYRDPLAAVVRDNIRRGHGMTRLVVETDLWRELRTWTASKHPASVWVADECFGMTPPRVLESDDDVLNSLAFGDWSSLGHLGSLFTPEAATLKEALNEDLRSLVDRNRHIEDIYLMRDYLYLDQRLPRLLSWREAFAGCCGEVRNPLIDRDLLQFKRRLPRQLTAGKRIFREAITDMFPDLFSIERARSGPWFAGQWCRKAIRDQPGELKLMLQETNSPLDKYLPPERLQLLIDRERSRIGTLRRMELSARRAKGRVRARLRRSGKGSTPLVRPRRPVVDPAVFVIRAVILRENLRICQDPFA